MLRNIQAGNLKRPCNTGMNATSTYMDSASGPARLEGTDNEVRSLWRKMEMIHYGRSWKASNRPSTLPQTTSSVDVNLRCSWHAWTTRTQNWESSAQSISTYDCLRNDSM